MRHVLTVLMPVFPVHQLKYPLFAVSPGGLTVTLPRLGSRVRVSFLAQRKAFHYGRLCYSQQLINMYANITTEHGTMTVEFFEKDAPHTVANFVKLAKEGFYEGLKFHRVIPGFVAQGGCPNGIGNGGPGYTIDCELDGNNQYHDLGVLSMAHAGRNTGGSQFFLVHSREATAHLDGNHTCFGRVTEGIEIVTQITQGETFSVEIIEG